MIETTRPIRVSLTNTRRHNLSQLALFTPGSSYSTQFAPDLYLITEPWWRIGDEPDAPHFSVKEPAGYYPILPVQSVPMHHHSFGEVFPVPLLVQLEAIPSHPITVTPEKRLISTKRMGCW